MWQRPAPSLEVRPVLVIHDEVVIESPVEFAEDAREWLASCMKDGMSRFLKQVQVEVEADIMETWAG